MIPNKFLLIHGILFAVGVLAGWLTDLLFPCYATRWITTCDGLEPHQNEDFLILRDKLEATVQIDRENNIQIHCQVPSPDRKGIWCSENVNRSLFVSVSGDVSPCVFTNLPVDGVSHCVNSEETKLKRLIFGNVNDQPLLSIWRRKEYRTFRNGFFNKIPPTACMDCPKLRVEVN